MTTVVLCNRLDSLKTFLKNASGPHRLLCLFESQESRLIRDYLSQRPDTEELPKAELLRERSEQFRRRFVDFMGALNGANHSRLWWAMTFTNKNPQSTGLCRNTADFLLIVDLLRSDSRPLLVVTESPDLAAQTKVWGKRQRIKVIDLVKASGTWKRFLKANTPAGAIRASVRTLLLWNLTRRYRPERKPDENKLVIATLTHPRSFAPNGGYRDAYFGDLVDHLQGPGPKALIFAMLVEHPFAQLKRLKNLESDVPIVPLESCLTFTSLLACTLLALWASIRRVKPRGTLEIDGVDIGCLVQRSVNEGRHSGDLLLNLRMYYSARWLARNLHVERCLYPFENRSCEKMLLLGMSAASPETRLVGYQHSSLTMAHTNFMLGPEEAGITPLPETILTTGEVATKWLTRESNIPPEIFKTAHALRQGQVELSKHVKHASEGARVLVALAASLEEYVGELSFLEKAFSGTDGYQVRIRPHPEFPLESALAIAPLAGPVFYTQSTESLADDLQWADMVLYSSSTVGMEAVSLGIPAINLNVGDFLSRDPMAGWQEFKWSAKEPAELIRQIKAIKSLSEHEFNERQKSGLEYVQAYLTPAGVDDLQAFWEA